MRQRLVKQGEGIWTVDHALSFAKVFGTSIDVPIRMTAIKLSSGSVLVHSPIHPDSAPVEELSSIGPIKHIVAPNKYHNLWSPLWKEKFPDATLYAGPGLPEKLKKVKWDVELVVNQPAPSEWKEDLDYVIMEGLPNLDEVAFLHKPSKTLLLTDFAFNYTKETPLALPIRLYLSLTKGYRECCVTTPFKWMVKDKEALRRSLDKVMQWDFDRVIMSHGTIIQENGKEKFAKGSYSFFTS